MRPIPIPRPAGIDPGPQLIRAAQIRTTRAQLAPGHLAGFCGRTPVSSRIGRRGPTSPPGIETPWRRRFRR